MDRKMLILTRLNLSTAHLPLVLLWHHKTKHNIISLPRRQGDSPFCSGGKKHIEHPKVKRRLFIEILLTLSASNPANVIGKRKTCTGLDFFTHQSGWQGEWKTWGVTGPTQGRPSVLLSSQHWQSKVHKVISTGAHADRSEEEWGPCRGGDAQERGRGWASQRGHSPRKQSSLGQLSSIGARKELGWGGGPLRGLGTRAHLPPPGASRAAGPTGHQTRVDRGKPLTLQLCSPCPLQPPPWPHRPRELWNPGLTSLSSPLLFPRSRGSMCLPPLDASRKALKGSALWRLLGAVQSIPPSPSYPPPTEGCHSWDSSHLRVSPLTHSHPLNCSSFPSQFPSEPAELMFKIFNNR